MAKLIILLHMMVLLPSIQAFGITFGYKSTKSESTWGIPCVLPSEVKIGYIAPVIEGNIFPRSAFEATAGALPMSIYDFQMDGHINNVTFR